jgi:hypothetical protein
MRDPPPIDANVVTRRIGSRAQYGNDRPVDRNPAILDEHFSRTPGNDACRGDKLL